MIWLVLLAMGGYIYVQAQNGPAHGEFISLLDSADALLDKGRFFDARKIYQDANQQATTIQSTDSVLYRRYLMEFGAFNLYCNEQEAARHHLLEANALSVALYGPESKEVARVLRLLGRTENQSYEFEKARDYYKDALTIYEKVTPNDHERQFDLLLALAYTYVWVENNEKTLFYVNKARKIFQKHFLNDPEKAISIYNFLGMVYNNLDDSALSSTNYHKALELRLKEPVPNPSSIGSLHRNLGILNFDFKNYPLARKHWIESLELEKQSLGETDITLASLTTWIGETYHEDKQYEQALEWHQRSLQLFSPDKKLTSIYENPPPPAEDFVEFFTGALQEKGVTLLAMWEENPDNEQNLRHSLECFELVVKTLDSLRLSMSGIEGLSLVNSRISPTMKGALNACLHLWNKSKDPVWMQKAFWFLEKAKSVTLLAALATEKALISEGNARAELVNREKNLRKELGDLQKELYFLEAHPEGIDPEKIPSLKSELFRLRKEHKAVIQEFKTTFPEYFELKYEMEVMPLGTVQERLENRQVFIQYFHGDSATYAMVVTQNASALYPLAHSQNLSKKIKSFISHFQVEKVQDLSEHENWAEISASLYKELIAPLESHFPKNAHLIISPSGPMAYLPFEILIRDFQSTGNQVEFTSLPYLFRDYAISYANSATVLFGYMDLLRPTPAENLLAFAPSFEGSTGPGRKGLNNLQFNQNETKQISTSQTGDVMAGTAATEKAFKEMAGNYRIIHLATHGLVEDEEPMFSKVAFAEGGDESEDGYLHLYELFSMELNAELAVLSACNTGEGQLHEGEGLMSLARGFLFAGCPSVVMTLWEVDDLATSGIMADFYDQLSAGKSKPEALRKAKLNYLKDAPTNRSHPFFWAGFVQFGDPRPMEKRSMVIWALVGGLVLILGFTGIAINRRRKASRRAI